MLKNYLSQAIEMSKTDNNTTKIKFKEIVKFLYPYLQSYKSKIVLVIIIMFSLSLISLPAPYLTKYIIDDVLINKLYTQLHIIVLIMLLLSVSRILLSFFMDYSLAVISQKVINKIRSDLFSKIIKLPMFIINRSQTGYLVSRIGEVQQLRVLFSSSILQILVSLFEFMFSVLILLIMNWQLALVSFLTIPLFYFVTKWFSIGLKRTSKDLMEKSALLSKDIQDSLSGIETIKSFTTESRQSKKIDKVQNAVLNSTMVQNVFMKLSGEAIGFVASTSSLLILWASGIFIMHGSFTIGMYFAFSGYLSKVYAPTSNIASINLIFQPASIALSRVKEFFDTVTEDEEKDRKIHFKNITQSIQFHNVYFRYELEKFILNNVSFCIEKGKKTAFVGPSGSGKSTIIRLILGYYRASEGLVDIDGINIDHIILKDFRDKIGIINQNIFLFNDTFRNNILISKPDATEKELLIATQNSGIHELVSNLPEGYNTMVSERGNNLSGGQIQRLAIARLILRNPSILIFDEATSQLDGESEKIINEALEKIFVNKTRIIISHRLSNIKTCDKIYVINNGIIVQEGNHNILIKEKGIYQNLYSV